MNILVISAHMDDETLGPGGTIAKHSATGDKVTVCIVCNRAYNHFLDPEKTSRDKTQCFEAVRILGCSDVRFLDLHDELLDRQLLDIIVPIEECVSEVKPAIVYTHHRGDSNQDHRAVFSATMVACRTISRFKVPKILSYEVPSSTDIAPPFTEFAFQPNYYVNVSDYLDTKCQAMTSYREELKEFPHPRSLDGIRTLARKRGMEVGFHAAEAFLLLRDEWA